jgi:putative ABC transport system permease protein
VHRPSPAQVGGVAAVAPEVRSGVTVVAEGRNWATTVVGTTNDYFKTNNWRLQAGRVFEPGELAAGSPVCVIGATVRRELFGTSEAIGRQVRVKQFSCDVIGVLAGKGQAGIGGDQDDTVILPVATMQRRVTGSTRVNALLVSMNPDSDSEQVITSITRLLRERRKLAAGDDDNFNVLDTQQVAETLSGTTRLLTSLLGAVAAVSLLVGGIGIMNIMLVSVTERTREIGLRLAIGALEREVLAQFLVEAVVLAALGGLVGLAAGAGGVASLGPDRSHAGALRVRCPASTPCWPSCSRRPSAWSSATCRRAARPGWTRSRRCGTSRRPLPTRGWPNPLAPHGRQA